MKKQIEEIGKTMCRSFGTEDCVPCDAYRACMIHLFAEDVYKAGYRRASDVAEEIFAEIENWFELYSEREYSFAEEETSKGHCTEAEAHDYALDIIKDLRYLCVAELKKKYTEGNQ